MHLPLIHPAIHSDICVIGDVTVHETAVIAPGSILQAAPGCRIVIREGVCVGMGSILNAYGGDIEVEAGAMLGAGVLIVGWSNIGKNACLGSGITILNTSVAQQAVLEAGKLIGDRSRSIEQVPQTSQDNEIAYPQPDANSPVSDSNGKTNGHHSTTPEEESEPIIAAEEPITQESEPEIENPSTETVESESTQKVNAVVGQMYINQLLVTLFPERQRFNRSQNSSS